MHCGHIRPLTVPDGPQPGSYFSTLGMRTDSGVRAYSGCVGIMFLPAVIAVMWLGPRSNDWIFITVAMIALVVLWIRHRFLS